MKMTPIECLGYVFALYLGLKLSLLVLSYVYRRYLKSPLNVKKLGEWALVTGSTDGIGKAYAFALAKKGMNIVLVSRSPFKLQNVAAEIESKFKVKTKIIDVDFTTSDTAYIPKIEEEIQGLELGVLVNNVGMSYDHPEMFLSIDNGDEKVKNLVALNITSVNAMTRLILPQMVERKKGAIINISSMSCLMPCPLLTVYAATKAYVDNFTTNLNIEYRSKGITVQCVLPGYVVSNLSKIKRPNFITPSPDTFVKSAIARLGVDTKTTGFWVHSIIVNLTNALPTWLAEWASYDQINAIRKKALKKKQKEQ